MENETEHRPRRVDVLDEDAAAGRPFSRSIACTCATALRRYLSRTLTRLVFERGDSAAVLPYDPCARHGGVGGSNSAIRHTCAAATGWLWESVSTAAKTAGAP
jgi:hypothetical protein